MKKFVAILLALSLLCGCGEAREVDAPETNAPVSESAPVETPAETPTPAPEAPAETVVEDTPVEELPLIEAVDCSAITLAEVANEELSVFYPADDWTPLEDFSLLTLLWNETADSENSVNINVQKSAAFDAALNQAFLDQILAMQSEVAGAQALTINVAEVRQLCGEAVLYLENVTEINDEVLDLMVAEGVLTEEQIEASGGRDALKAIPPTKSVAIYGVIDGYLTMFTGTYYDDVHKDVVLEAMTVLYQNTRVTGV